MRALAASVLVLAALSSAGVAFGQEPGDPNAGQLSAQSLCGTCHATAAGVERSPHPKAAAFTKIAQRPELSAMSLSVWLKSSHANMPLFRVEADTIEDITAYLKTLRTPAAPR